MRPLDRVGLRITDAYEFIESVIACVRMGAVYAPIDKKMPLAAVREVIANAKIDFLVIDAADAPDGLDIPCLPAPPEAFDEQAISWSPGEQRTDDPVCIMFTSGSSGTPKGVICPLGGIVPLVTGDCHLPILPDDTVLQISSREFDLFTWEVWGALLNGARLYVLPQLWSVTDLERLIRQGGVTAAFFTARLFDLLVESAPETLAALRMVSFGGEPASPYHCALARRVLPNTQLINGYGPTEDTTFCCSYVLGDGADTDEIVPIGTPKMGDIALLLDPDTLAPIEGEGTGELFVGGPGLAIGYTDPELTRQKFIVHPELGIRLFRTNDAVRRLPSGDYHYLGRRDRQVKILGHRVDLFDVERLLALHPEVASAHVVFNDTFQRNEVVAFYRTHDGQPLPRQSLTAFLKDKVVAHGMPQWFEHVGTPPLKPNGKIDVPAMVAGLRERVSQPAADDPLTKLWGSVLHPAPVSEATHFFDDGGDSLAALTVVLETEKLFGVSLSADYLDKYPVLADFRRNLLVAREASLISPPIQSSPDPVLVLVPWLGGSASVFENVVNGLRFEGQVVSLDLSLLRSDASIRSVRDISRKCAEAFSDAGVQRVSLMGPSLGGVLALDLAAELAERGIEIDSVVMIDSYAPWLISLDKLVRDGKTLLSRLGVIDKRHASPTKAGARPVLANNDERYPANPDMMARMSDRFGLYSRFRPRIPRAASVALVKAESSTAQRLLRRIPDHGWRRRLPGLHTSKSGGGHLSMLDEAHGPQLGQHISRLLKGRR